MEHLRLHLLDGLFGVMSHHLLDNLTESHESLLLLEIVQFEDNILVEK